MSWFRKSPDKLTPDDLADELESRELKAVLDYFHFSRIGKLVDAKFSEPEQFVETLLKRKLIHAIHLGFFRHDFKNIDPQRHQQSVDEGKALIENGNLRQYPLSDSLAMLEHYNWQGNLTVETTTAGMEASLGRIAGQDVELHHSLSTGVRTHTQWLWTPAAA